MPISLYTEIPDFALPATGGNRFSLKAQRGKWLVLYFYPKDNTSGCTREGEDFRDLHEQFIEQNGLIFGISRDGLKSHENFKAKYQFPFELLSDAEETACRLFDVIKEKSMYGRKYMGIERSTFLIDDKGILRAQWRKVSLSGHAAAVLEALKEERSKSA
jgi:peroxiredoxin Q/BCP